jgi:hypothetical protein
MRKTGSQTTGSRRWQEERHPFGVQELDETFSNGAKPVAALNNMRFGTAVPAAAGDLFTRDPRRALVQLGPPTKKKWTGPPVQKKLDRRVNLDHRAKFVRPKHLGGRDGPMFDFR